jgi:hypothetical protein
MRASIWSSNPPTRRKTKRRIKQPQPVITESSVDNSKGVANNVFETED